MVGNIGFGAHNPIRIQSMCNTNTSDTNNTVNQCIRIFDAGADLVRITCKNISEAKNLKNIKKKLHENGYYKPLAADIHFNPKIAIEAASIVEKIRINPGNFVNLFPKNIEYTDEEYQRELDETAITLKPLIAVCKKHATAIRIGINHGSLSRRILSKYGDTAIGMLESALEFIRMFHRENFHSLIISMKSSDVRTMIWSSRLLAQKMSEENFNYPIHLGVTEAGAAESGRIKSAIGIGSLLIDGIGDTIRVSLTEAPEKEIPVAKKIIKSSQRLKSSQEITKLFFNKTSPFSYFINTFEKTSKKLPQVYSKTKSTNILVTKPGKPDLQNSFNYSNIDDIRSKIIENPKEKLIITYNPSQLALYDFIIATGSIFSDGFGNAILIEGKEITEKDFDNTFFLLQSCKRRISTAEFISCPSCGRTSFNIEKILAEAKNKFSHLNGISIAIMGCIVNGPGEMAGATYGILGNTNKLVHIYYKGFPVRKNIQESKSTEILKEIMKENGDYHEQKPN